MDISPYLSAIQELDGENPAEKYKYLHFQAVHIINSENEKKEFLEAGTTSRIQSALLPLLRIIVGNKLKHVDTIIASLKSNDVIIIEQALKAKWFFNANNEYINVDFFLNHVTPFVSLRTRRRLFKTLARYLVSYPHKADNFFRGFVDVYGLDETLPIIVSCTEQFILDTVFKRKILLPHKILKILYLRCPQFVIRYLQLGNEKNKANWEDRKIHKIEISHHLNLLPMIVKHHPRDFIEIYEHVSWCYDPIKFGSTRAKYVLTHYTDLIIQKANVMFQTLPLKILSSKISIAQFETLYEKLFPENISELSVYDMVQYLQYYPKEKKFQLLRDKYKLTYGKDILDHEEIYKTTEFFRILPTNMKADFARKVLELYEGKDDQYYELIDYLPPGELIPMLKERIFTAKLTQKIDLIQSMIASCSYYDSKDDLLKVLLYYNNWQKHERTDTFYRVLHKVMQQFIIEDLDWSCWQIILDIVQRAYVKGDFYNSKDYFYWPFFHGGLMFFVRECQKNASDEKMKQHLDNLIAMLLDCYLEHNMKVDPLPCSGFPADFERICLKKYLVSIPLLYNPETHEVWSKFGNKLALVSYFIKSIHEYNFQDLCHSSKKNYKLGITVGGKRMLKLLDYPWLVKFASDLLKKGKTYDELGDKEMYYNLKHNFKLHDIELYKTLTDGEDDVFDDLEPYSALYRLKYDYSKVSSKWQFYLNSCKKNLNMNKKCARSFIKRIKWHQNLPIKFVKQCVKDIEDDGSILVLASLLEGDAFDKITKHYVPQANQISLSGENAKKTYRILSSVIKGMNCVNPFENLDIVFAFCQGDYVPLSYSTLINVSERVPVNKVLAFTEQLMDKSPSVKRLGIKLVFRVSSKFESNEFLRRHWDSETHPSIRVMIVKMIWNVFKQTPSITTWHSMKTCICGLTVKDLVIFEMITNLDGIDKNFVTPYVQQLLIKIDELNENTKLNLVCSMVESIDKNIINFMSDEVATDILRRYFFEYNVRFILDAYLLSDPENFETRLKTLMDILQEEFKKYNKPHLKYPRHYPSNFQLHNFFQQLIGFLLCTDKSDMGTKLSNAALDLIKTEITLYDDPLIFADLSLLKDYMECPTPKEFGIRCAITVSQLIENLNSEMILEDIVKFLERMLCNSQVYPGNGLALRLTVIEGLSKNNPRLGALIGIKLLSLHNAAKYDERYDEFVEKWKEMKDPMVQATLNNYKSQVPNYEK